MPGDNDEDKATVILDLNALKKQKLEQEQDLANMASELEFNVAMDEDAGVASKKGQETPLKTSFPVILFDFQSDLFEKSQNLFPGGFQYKIVKTLQDLNLCLRSKEFKLVVFNYDVNPKAINQLSAQIKEKFPTTKTLIMARAISPSKALAHAKTAAGANGYYQFPLDAKKIEQEFTRISTQEKKVS